MAKIKMRRLETELYHARARLFDTHEKRMAEIQSKIVEIKLGRKAGTDTANERSRGWRAYAPTWAKFVLAGRDINDASRLVQNTHASVSWAPRAASDLRRWMSRSER